MPGDRHHIVAFALAILVLAGCATSSARLNQYRGLAAAGAAYHTAMVAVIDEAMEVSIDRNSLDLSRPMIREGQTRAGRLTLLTQRNDELREATALFGDLKRHLALVKDYFAAIEAIASTDAGSGLSSATQGVVKALGEVSTSLRGANVGGLPLDAFVADATPFLVAGVRVRALQSELEKHGAAIDRELQVQEELLAFLASTIQEDADALLRQQEEIDVFVPYQSDKPLPANWSQVRKAYVTRRADMQSVEHAADASRKLRAAFRAMAEGRLEAGDLTAIVEDMNRITTLVEKIRRPTEST